MGKRTLASATACLLACPAHCWQALQHRQSFAGDPWILGSARQQPQHRNYHRCSHRHRRVLMQAAQGTGSSTFQLYNTAGASCTLRSIRDGDHAVAQAAAPLCCDVHAERSRVTFKPLDKRRVTFYSCGPTVYDSAHIGNFRAFLTYDVLKRWLAYRGFQVSLA